MHVHLPGNMRPSQNKKEHRDGHAVPTTSCPRDRLFEADANQIQTEERRKTFWHQQSSSFCTCFLEDAGVLCSAPRVEAVFIPVPRLVSTRDLWAGKS